MYRMRAVKSHIFSIKTNLLLTTLIISMSLFRQQVSVMLVQAKKGALPTLDLEQLQ